MKIRVDVRIVQVTFDQEYKGTVRVVSPHGLIRTFDFQLTDPAGDHTKLSVTHQNQPFFDLTGDGDDDEANRALEGLPRGRQLLIAMFLQPIVEAYRCARRDHAMDEWSADNMMRRARWMGGTIVFAGQISVEGQVSAEAVTPKTDEFGAMCTELTRLPMDPIPASER